MRRPTLSTKLFIAALPLVVAVVALLALTVRSDINDVRSAESGAELGAVWSPLIAALTAVETEVVQTTTPDSADSADVPIAATRRATDQAVNELRDDIESLGASEAAGAHVTAGRSALSAARRNLDMMAIAPDLQTEIDPFEAYELASRELVAVGQLLPSEAGDPELGRDLLAVVKLAEAKLSANSVITGTQQWEADPTDISPLLTARSAFAEMEATLGEFQAIAPDEWAAEYRQSGFPSQLSQFRGDLDRALRAAQAGEAATLDTTAFGALVSNGVQFQSAISQEIVDRASLEADDTRQTSMIRIGVSLGAVLVAALIALFITRSITRRIKAVSTGANQVATEQLPTLVEALRDPRGKTTLPDIQPVNARGNDELAELAGAFNSMQDTLVDVAHEQVEVLRRGVSDIFVTMARRNRSLIDRQLAMLDEFEAEVDDHAVLANYYQLDHLATRMRRNSESLLVLASAEPKRRRVKATEIDDVVRASIGEVEDYRRIDIEHLESLQVRGAVVADVSHLIAELLDNATAFSPPESPVRVGGRRAGDSYLLRIVDSGIGIPTERLGELNELLREPPVVGLSVESTLGISVVSLLANKHDIEVTLSAGNPGLTVDIALPSTLFGPIDDPSAQSGDTFAHTATVPAGESIVAWNDDDPSGLEGLTIDEAFQPVAEIERTEAERIEAEHTDPQPDFASALGDLPTNPVGIDDERPVAAADWTKMSLSLSAFQSGQRSAAQEPVETVTEQFEPTVPVVASSHIPELDSDETFAPTEPDQLVPGESDLLPPPDLRARGEFDSPLAPPVLATGPMKGPVAPESARSAPRSVSDSETKLPNLPTRSPGTGPDGPDRLGDTGPDGDHVSSDAGTVPSALQSALSALDGSITGANGSNATLPQRAHVEETVGQAEQPLAATSSRLDPDALRDRLRAFQTEFHSADADGDPVPESPPSETNDDHHDLGGDLR